MYELDRFVSSPVELEVGRRRSPPDASSAVVGTEDR